MEQCYVPSSLPNPCSLLFSSTRREALVLPSALSAANGKGANQTRKSAPVPGSVPSSKPADTTPAGWTARLGAAPALPIPAQQTRALPFPVCVTAASVSPRREAAAPIPPKAHHGLYSLVLYFFF